MKKQTQITATTYKFLRSYPICDKKYGFTSKFSFMSKMVIFWTIMSITPQIKENNNQRKR
jgi:hypothetical protein